MPLPGFFVDNSSVPADFHRLAAVALMRRHELDAAVAVPVVVPVHKRRHPQAGFLSAGEWASWVVRPVFRCSEQRFGVRVVVRHPWSGEGTEDSQFLQPGLQRRGTHGVAVVGMQHQEFLAAFADPLADTGPAHQIGCDGCILALGDIPGDDLAAPDVDHQIEVQPHPSYVGGQVGDVPAPHLVRT